MSVIHMTEQNYEEMIKEGIVLVDFYAEWCGPCKMLGPILETLSTQRNDVKIIKVNVDEHAEIAGHYSIMSVPTLHLYKDGNLLSEKKGFYTIDMFNEWIDENLK